MPVAQACNSYAGGTPGAYSGLLAYYRPGGYPLLISQGGDEQSTATLFETWEWKCGWQRATGPDPRVWGYAMADDPPLHMTILIGRKTWGWDGSGWLDLQIKPPVNVGSTSMVFDAAHQVLVLVDTYPTGVNTWTFDGRAWNKVSTSGPANEEGAALAYDPRSRTVVLFGGVSSTFGGGGYQTTWSWDGLRWRELNPDTSPPEGPAVMAYDDGTRQMILVTWDTATWEWTGTTWRQLTIDTPIYTTTAKLIYDSVRQQLFYWASGSVWTYAGTWVQVPLV